MNSGQRETTLMCVNDMSRVNNGTMKWVLGYTGADRNEDPLDRVSAQRLFRTLQREAQRSSKKCGWVLDRKSVHCEELSDVIQTSKFSIFSKTKTIKYVSPCIKDLRRTIVSLITSHENGVVSIPMVRSQH